MSEFWKCKGSDRSKDCPLKKNCLRFLAEPAPKQKYYLGVPYEENGERCDSYLPPLIIEELKTNLNGNTNKYHLRKKRR